MKVVKCVIRVLAIGCYLLSLSAFLLLLPVMSGKEPMIVLSGSMQPTFREGSLIYREEAGFDEVKVGDIVSYGDEEIVSHRVIAKMEQIKCLITRGDANESIDPEVSAEQVRGRVWEGVYIPYAGYVMQALKTPGLILFMIAVITLNIVIQYREIPNHASECL